MKTAIKQVFDELLAMPEAEFYAALKAHENSDLAQALLYSGRIKMNISKAIFDKMQSGDGLIEIICELVEGSDEIDYHDVADAIRENPSMMDMLTFEFKALKMIPADAEDINLTEIFKGL